jgi:hypothetical protein
MLTRELKRDWIEQFQKHRWKKPRKMHAAVSKPIPANIGEETSRALRAWSLLG